MVEENYNEVYSLNLQNMRWEKLKIMGKPAEPRSSHTAKAHKFCMYIFGGVFR